jgi:hypothetical protein
MTTSGVAFEKDAAFTKRVLDVFEKIRFSYLSALEDPKEYRNEWKKAVKSVRKTFDDLNDFTREMKKFVDDQYLFDDEVENPTSIQAKKLYDDIKRMRFSSKKVSDPFSEQLGDNVLDKLLENESMMIAFLHYAIRSETLPIKEKAWKSQGLKPDEITSGYRGLDLQVDDIALYIMEHYGEGKDTERVEDKVEAAMKKLEKLYFEDHTEEEWKNLVALDNKLKKSEEEKSEVDFYIPNKPMYRIFEIDDMKYIKGLSGEFVVQEKYDGMRIQIHKKGSDVKIFSFNKKDITKKCKKQVDEMKKRHFGDCTLDAELVGFKGKEDVHRADVVSHIFKKEVPELDLRAHVFDIMYHEDKIVAEEPLRERINILFYQYSQHSSENLAFPSKKDTRIADSIEEVNKYSKDIMELPASEGVVIKDIESTYYVGIQKNPKWIKWKKFVDLDVVVLDKKKTNSNLFSYSLGIGPVTAEQARENKTVDMDDVAYVPVGRALNTKESVDVGSIVRVKVDEVRRNGKGYSLYSAKVIEIPEVKESDKLQTLEILADESKKSLIEESKDYSVRMEGLKKAIITDGIHGDAEIILKSDLDGFQVYGIEGDDLMAKNALYDIDIWKEELAEVIKTIRSELRMGIFQFLKEKGTPTTYKDILEFVKEKHEDKFEGYAFDGEQQKLKEWMMNQNHFIYDKTRDTFEENEEVIAKDATQKMGKFVVNKRKDDNLDLVLMYDDMTFGWTIDIDNDEDIFNLFGKSNKYPAEISTNLQNGYKLDEGDVEFGVQRHGYHEYRLDGDKFKTRLHARVVPIDGEDSWVVFTGIKQEMLDSSEDDGLIDITKDRNKKLTLSNVN